MKGVFLTAAGVVFAMGIGLAAAQTAQQPGEVQTQPEPQAQMQPQQQPEAGQRSPQTNIPPFPGANSFTEEQAREHIAKAGYAEVSNLKLDKQGIWRGTGTKEGQQFQVALDYRGNIVQIQ